MWLTVSCVAQSKARVYTGEWRQLLNLSYSSFTTIIDHIHINDVPMSAHYTPRCTVSLSLRFLFPCWLGVSWYEQLPVMVTVALWIHPTITACLPSACEMTTHSWSIDTLCSPCKSMLELQLFRGEIKDFITGVITMWDLCKTLNKAIQNAESLCRVNHCMASFHQLSLVCSTIQSQ